MTARIAPLTLVAIFLLAGCGGGSAGSVASAGDGTASTGLYETSSGEKRGQLCLLRRDGGAETFGIITWGRGDANCSGAGTVRREEDRLRLLLDGDESCAIVAEADGATVRVTQGLTGDCALYYCAGGATLDGAAFARSGEGPDAAGRAHDLVGAPLCRDGNSN